jgi:hypothetical protein
LQTGVLAAAETAGARLVSIRLELLTESFDVSVRDDAGGQGEERFVDVVAAFPPDA